MSKISVILGCCLNGEEMEEFIKEYPDYFEDKSTEDNNHLEIETVKDIVK